MEFIDYRKKDVDNILSEELGWQYYGGHHHENLYTRFFQSYYLPKKFNIDKRKTELSALVRSGQVIREDALRELSESEYGHEEKTVIYAINKLGLSQEEFDEIMKAPVKSLTSKCESAGSVFSLFALFERIVQTQKSVFRRGYNSLNL